MKKHSTTPCPYVQLPFVFPPRVIRNKRIEFTPGFRRRFLKMHDHICAYCGHTATTIDHFLPVNAGGTNLISNLQPACLFCNSTAQHRVFDSLKEKQRYIVTRRIQIGTLPEPIAGDARLYAACIDCGHPYRFASNATIFLCPVCRYMDEHAPLPTWRRNRIDSFIEREFRGQTITEII